eukprot:2627104-Prymnesium_polylepis.1
MHGPRHPRHWTPAGLRCVGAQLGARGDCDDGGSGARGARGRAQASQRGGGLAAVAAARSHRGGGAPRHRPRAWGQGRVSRPAPFGCTSRPVSAARTSQPAPRRALRVSCARSCRGTRAHWRPREWRRPRRRDAHARTSGRRRRRRWPRRR